MGIDTDKMLTEEFLSKMDNRKAHEILNNISDEFIKFSRNKTVNYCLDKKSGLKGSPTPRVLHNWETIGLVKVDKKDKGKIKRFDKLESIWINILVEMRAFGMSIGSIQRTRNLLFKYVFNDFTLFKFYILESIIQEPQILMIYKDGGANVFPKKAYFEQLEKGMFYPHLSLNLGVFIEPEYPNHSLEKEFSIDAPYENLEKTKLLFFLKTGGFQYMKVKLSDGDIRYIENVKMLLKSEDVLQAFSNWEFEEINISIDDDTSTIITSKI